MVELNDLVAGAQAGIAHFDVGLLGRRVPSQIPVVERGVAEAVSERIERGPRVVEVGASPSFDVVVSDRRQRLLAWVPRHGQPPARRGVAEEQLGEGMTGFLTSVGGVEHGVDLVLPIANGERVRSDDDHHGAAIGSGDSPHKTHLLGGESETGSVDLLLAVEKRVVADEDHGGLGPLGRCHGLLQPVANDLHREVAGLHPLGTAHHQALALVQADALA